MFRYSKKKGRRPQNLEPWAGYWLITDRAKAVFEAVDPFAFDFMACEITYDDGSPAVPAWFCDVVRFVDAMDEELSDVQVFHDGRTRYHLVVSRWLVFKPDEVGPAHIFRIAHAPSKVVCDDVLRKACKDAKLKSLAFIDAIR